MASTFNTAVALRGDKTDRAISVIENTVPARWELTVAGAANLTFAVAAIALAVFKPGGRVRPDAGPARRDDRRVSPPPAV
jgi:hypothetical protein